MYADRYGTDWGTISFDEAIDRAYALGVAEVLGEHHDEEYDRLESVADSNYERSMIELAYQDGKNEAAGVYDDHDEDEGVWGELVEDDEVTAAEEPDHEGGDTDPGDADRDSRSAVTRGEMIDRREEDSREAVGKPDFLERE